MCAVVGAWNLEGAADVTFHALYALQHRGEETAGLAVPVGERLWVSTGSGLVDQVLAEDPVRHAEARSAIGHTRYSTTASKGGNAQPLFAQTRFGPLAVAHNGNITNYRALRAELEEAGAIFSTTSDTETLLHLVARSKERRLEGALIEAYARITGAATITLLAPDALYALRDRHGFRPLTIGTLDDGYVLASESCALDLVEARYIGEVGCGEMIRFDAEGMHRYPVALGDPAPKQCIFEFVYFSRPDSTVFGRGVDGVRRDLGRQLGREAQSQSDLVIAVPDSSNTAAKGYAETAGIHEDIGLIRNHYIGRTFIRPDGQKRTFGARVKYNPVCGRLEGKKVDVVDDSIVRGTTSQRLVTMLRTAHPAEIHFQVASPPITGPCPYGIDTPRREDLAAHNYTHSDLSSFIGADSLTFLSLEGLRACVPDPQRYCMACFDGEYPTPTGLEEDT